jgi:hypothetical protein
MKDEIDSQTDKKSTLRKKPAYFAALKFIV